jgi:hypothetical protein
MPRSARFPMQDGPDVDWTTAEEIYKMYSYLFGTEQSLDRLAERGGFGWEEVSIIVKRYHDKKRKQRMFEVNKL